MNGNHATSTDANVKIFDTDYAMLHLQNLSVSLDREPTLSNRGSSAVHMLPDSTVRTNEETTGEAAARMEKVSGHVLIAAGAWDGLDTLTRWRHVVMPKAPYGPPTILDEHEVSRYVDSRDTAVRRFRQGMARGLRTPDAVCTLHLLDGRFDRPEFINALPPRFARSYLARFGVIELRTRQAEFRKRIFEKFNGLSKAP